MTRRERMQTTVVLGVFALVFIALTVSSYMQKSSTWDETAFVAAGYVECKLQDYRLIAEHPPLVRMWSVLPLLGMPNIQMATNDPSWVSGNPYTFSHKFLYVDNDADRLLYRARFMIVLLGVLLGFLLFGWVRDWYGFWPAVGTLGLYASEPNLLAHSSLATTDLGVTCFIFGTLYFLWRTTRDCRITNVLGLAAFLALAQVSKFSALFLWAIVPLGLMLPVCRRAPWPCPGSQVEAKSFQGKVLMAGSIMAVVIGVTYVAIWGIYGFQYAPTPWAAESVHLRTTPAMQQFAPRTAALMGWIDQHHLLPNVYGQGLAYRMATIQQVPSYLAGQYSLEGWWYYFPLAFLVKTRVTLLVLFFGGIVWCAVRRSTLLEKEAFVLVPLAVYMVASMNMNINIGLRHILPLYPLVLMLCGKTIDELRRRIPPYVVAGLVSVALLEGVLVWPDFLAYFNVIAGGPSQGQHWLVDSNLDWGQDLKGLKRWMDAREVRHINLSYFGTADPAYYHIDCTHLQGEPFFHARSVTEPQLPGYVAVSVQNLHGGVGCNEKIREFYQPLLKREPVTVIGHSIFVYWIDRPWW